MNPEERREAILEALHETSGAVTGQDLSERLSVSRQVIVQDIAILRANGKAIVATPRGYVFSAKPARSGAQAIVACRHGMESVREELLTVVQNGGEVVDVIVEHPLYGQITGVLMLRNEKDVDDFIQRVGATGASLLSSLTKGVHLHTIRARDSRALGGVLAGLGARGFLVREDF